MNGTGKRNETGQGAVDDAGLAPRSAGAPARWVRACLPSSLWTIDAQRAVSVAAEAACRRGLPWIGPVRAYRYYGDWSVQTRAGHRGGNVYAVVSAQTGEVRALRGPTPR